MHLSKPLAVEGSRTGHGSSLSGMSLVYGPPFTPIGKDNIFVVLEYIKVIGTLYVIKLVCFSSTTDSSAILCYAYWTTLTYAKTLTKLLTETLGKNETA